jgi:transcriptional regulator with XRE-family HTH domain
VSAVLPFNEQLRAARERAGLTREEVATETHRSAHTVWRWESGQAAPPGTVIGTLRRLLDLDDPQ